MFDMTQCITVFLAVIWTALGSSTIAQTLRVDPAMHHLRNQGEREWSAFAPKPEHDHLKVSFGATANAAPQTLAIRQCDVRVNWTVTLNGQVLGSLIQDEKDLLCYLTIPPGTLADANELVIATTEKRPDDISVGEIVLYHDAPDDLLHQSTVRIEVRDGDTDQHLPSRITIVNTNGTLQPVSVAAQGAVAVRPGYVFTGKGQASIGLPAGTYTLFATRGPEYGVDSVTITMNPGDHLTQSFRIRREVNTRGWAGSDTHVHTFTWSGHGDATALERAVTIAGEGIDLPIITEHNLYADLAPVAQEAGVSDWFTPVKGVEVTTAVGHFNVFPVDDETPIDHRARDWNALSSALQPSPSRVVILNHARDLHSGFRPFDPDKHLAIAGMRLDGWTVPANAMEVINSGAQQSDQLQLTHDWFGMLNGGQIITPVGSSDSHDVSRFFVGQARTFIRCNDDNAGTIDLREAVRNFIDGNVTVSFGLLAHIEVNDTYGPGELVPGADAAKVTVTVSGPAWLKADKVTLYANGKKVREQTIDDPHNAGVKWRDSWELTMPPHDVFLVAVAEGPGDHLPYWPIAKPYRPVSTEWNPRIFAVTGAVWLDGDHNQRRNTAREYATDLLATNDIRALIQRLSSFHQSVAVQVAALLHQRGTNLKSREIATALEQAAPDTRAAFESVIDSLDRR